MHGELWQTGAVQWALAARAVGLGQVGNLLADLAEDMPRSYTAARLRIPVAPTALALGLPTALLLAALERLEEEQLITHTLDGTDPEQLHAEIVLRSPGGPGRW
ncbi:hypothetical protein [Kitasatospora camelliae]|uniref:MarR family protein n=1 Tax=Kitasatospora camelliae TaxID=3156397 RepID=A0AAU8JQG7_9ACTN